MNSSDRTIDEAWSNIGQNNTIRWVTPRFVKYGRVLARKGRSMRVQFFDEPNERAIPDAKWYFGQWKMFGDEAEEHLCVVEYQPTMRGSTIPPAEFAQDNWLNVTDVAELLNWDEKRVRRYIRRGHIPAHKDNYSRWVVSRERLRDLAAKHGWV